MDTTPQWDDKKTSASGSDKGDNASVNVTELEKNESTSYDRKEYLVADYAQDVSMKVSGKNILHAIR